MSSNQHHHIRRLDHGLQRARQQQTGVALPAALILLILVTMVGLSAIRGTTMQQKMTSNLYDRGIALQNAEAGLNVAIKRYDEEVAKKTQANLIWHNCQIVTCRANPFEDTSLPATKLHTVSTGTTETTYTASNVAVGQPQYVMEDMGSYGSGNGSGSQSTSAENEGNDQIQPGKPGTFIRITVRSANPAAAGADSRAIVTLQALLKQ